MTLDETSVDLLNLGSLLRSRLGLFSRLLVTFESWDLIVVIIFFIVSLALTFTQACTSELAEVDSTKVLCNQSAYALPCSAVTESLQRSYATAPRQQLQRRIITHPTSSTHHASHISHAGHSAYEASIRCQSPWLFTYTYPCHPWLLDHPQVPHLAHPHPPIYQSQSSGSEAS